MTAPAVTVYVAGHGCKPCAATKRHLTKRGIAFTEVPIDGDVAKAAESLGLRQAPIVCVATAEGDNIWWDGHRPDRIDALVATDG